MSDTASTETLFTLSNDLLTVDVSSIGAELQSVRHADGLERLWCADPAVWGRKGPLLFPLIGRLHNSTYELNGQPIKAPKHGFCRSRAFAAQQLSTTCVRFTTSQDAETLACYPFNFCLEVEYELQGNSLVKTHRVTNTAADPAAADSAAVDSAAADPAAADPATAAGMAMPFELGGHEAYATCLLPGEHMADYRVRFQGLDALEYFDMDEEGMLRTPKLTLPLEDGCLTQTPQQAGIDTFVLENVPGSTVSLECTANDHTVTVDFDGFPYLGIWSAVVEGEARYLCLEPWSALPDALFSPRELAQKPGVRLLQPGETAELRYTMTFK